MKAIVFSDSHRQFSSMLDVIGQEGEETIDLLIHAGDVHRDVEDLMDAFPGIPCEFVLGNNDYFTLGVPNDRVFAFAGHKIFLTHGHEYGVEYGLSRLIARGRSLGAEICIFGHTHQKYLMQETGLWLLNPGSTPYSYGVIETAGDGLNITIKER